MTPLQIVALGVRLFALVWLLYTINNLHHVFMYLDTEAYRGASRPLAWVFAAIQLGVCALLWFFPRTIAALLLPARDADVPAPAPQLVEWQTLGVILIGLWAVADAVRNSIYWIGMIGFSPVPFRDFPVEWKSSALLNIPELAIGLWLMLGAKGFAAALFRLRTLGEKE